MGSACRSKRKHRPVSQFLPVWLCRVAWTKEAAIRYTLGMTLSAPALFLDDERFPPSDGRDWVIVRTVAAAVGWIKHNGLPSHVSFDNDLQNRLEGRHLAKWLIRKDAEAAGRFLPADFSWYVHSQNSKNGIDDLLSDWLRRRQDFVRAPARRFSP